MCASDFSRHDAWLVRSLVASALVFGTWVAHAQSDKDAEQVKRLRLQMRQVQQQQQLAQEEQAKADQARQKAEQALKAQEADLSKQRSQAASASQRASALGKELDALKSEHAKVQAELASINAQHQALVAASKAAQATSADRESKLLAQGKDLSGKLDRCVSDNAELADMGLSLLKRYEDKGIAEVLASNEPFVQTGRVKLENLKADYARRIEAARVKGQAPAAGADKP